uniref:Rho-GAP domain-containing protein n=1 Tax=Mucochytrium quahogii TaxID=96639 RepID=A0A7S2RJ73_9STRA|mmetsp:Transcript_37687/g.61358  ORF Transcript_37687/g.61358 Transcript_37687/m.61358 type:complete len:650 (-) Transcript_37687:1234-3183(-)|eukprot:CAMPEP_0203745150 /NCGR_PEP_ID=MMETSP0098-20131031/985_1 /ASSEMBLY_ACC=CAM_ASM_000208 /TAXON_ID=96639 /ORGANISM=" , Strain NY0313808BC1" /LENGTH=649 /DNA_ID=CAMNT_0050632851 /DNA_START=518 /DNA_END=2467 /DNA_ORIENTATION=+
MVKMDDEAKTYFVLEKCVAALDTLEPVSIPGLISPQIPLTEVVTLHNEVLAHYEACSEDSKRESKLGDIKDIFSEQTDPALIASVLWLHLRRRYEPLLPFTMFDELVDLVQSCVPLKNHTDALSKAYIESVIYSFQLEDLERIVLALPVHSRKNAKLVFGFVSNLLNMSELVTPLGVSNVVTPIICRPKDTAFMSIRHRKGIVFARLVIRLMFENFGCLEPMFDSEAPPPNRRTTVGSLNNHVPNLSMKLLPQQAVQSKDIPVSPPGTLEEGSESQPSSNDPGNHELMHALEVQVNEEAASPTSRQQKGPKKQHLQNEKFACLLQSSIQYACRGGGDWLAFTKGHIKDQVGDPVKTPESTKFPCPSPHRSPTKLSKRFHRGDGKEERDEEITEPDDSNTDMDIDNEDEEDNAINDNNKVLTTQHSLQHLKKAVSKKMSRSTSEGLLPWTAQQSDSPTNTISGIHQRINKAFEKGLSGSGNSEEERTEAKLEMDIDSDQDNQQRRDELLQNLETEKRSLKQKLKQFDEDFEKAHGRRPNRVEKEPIRNLYEEYNALKLKILFLGQQVKGKKQIEHPTNKQTARKPTMESLMREKRLLQGKLRAFERTFEEENSRKIKYAKDIQGYEAEYKRYKELKEQLTDLKQNIFTKN